MKFCSKGHLVAGDNVRIHHSGRGYKYPACRLCYNARQAAYYRENPEKRHFSGNPGYEPVPKEKLKNRRPGSKTCLKCKRRIAGRNGAKTRKKPDGSYYLSCRRCKNERQAIYDIERRG